MSTRSRRWPGLILVFVLVFICFSCTAQSQEFSLSPGGELLTIPRGESLLLPVFKPKRVAVSDPNIADVVIVNPEQVLVNGISVGTTSLQIWEDGGVTYYRVRVVPNPDALVAELRKQLGLPGLKINILNGKVILDGAIDNESQRERAVKAASAYGEVIDLLQVKDGGPGEVELAEAVAAVIQRPNVAVRIINGSIILEGEVSSPAERRRAEMLASTFSAPVLNFLEVSAEEAALNAAVEEIAREMGIPTVEVKVIAGRTLLLEGSVTDPSLKERAAAIAGALGRPVINLIEVEPPEPLAVCFDAGDIGEGAGTAACEEAAPSKLAGGVGGVKDDGVKDVGNGMAPTPDIHNWAHELQQEIGDFGVAVRVLRDALLLEGTVDSEHVRQRIRAIAGLYPVKVIDLLEVEGQPVEDFTKEKEWLVNYLQDPNIQVTLVGRTVLLEGEVSSDLARRRAVTVAKALGLDVVDLLVLKEDLDSKADSPRVVEDEKSAGELEPEEAALELSLVVPELTTALGEEDLMVYELNGFIVFEGKVPNEFRRLRAERLAHTFGVPLVMLIEVDSPKEGERSLDGSGLLGLFPVGTNLDDLSSDVEGAADRRDLAKVPASSKGFLEEADHGSMHHDAKKTTAAGSSPDDGEVGNMLRGVLDPAEDVPVRDLAAKVQEAIGLPYVTAKVVEGAVVLDGTVTSEEEAQGARAIAGIFSDKVVSRLVVVPEPKTPEPTLSEIIQAVLGLPDVQVRLVGEKVLLEGTVSEQKELDRALQIASAFGKQVVNLLKVEAPYQVLIEVKVIEASRSDLEQLGLSWGSLERGVLIPDKVLLGELIIGEPIERLLPLGAQLEALIDTGKARLLAAPSLLTLSGKEASFLSGGEIPVTVPKDGELQILWKVYGVKLEVLPVVLEDGAVEVTLKPEVSTLDWTNGIRIDSLTLPAMKTRRTETVVYIEDGTTFVIGGLLENVESEQVHKVPLLGDLPLLGKLFRSEKVQVSQTELVFFVTPHILRGNEPAAHVEPWLSRDTERGGQHLWVDDYGF
ncbi:MAG: BON domain-containing protein [Firmicutes bacterium]|nr:BON domain-containing protein [Bacillota bacterium]